MVYQIGTIVTKRLTWSPNSEFPTMVKRMPVEVFHSGKKRILQVPIYGSGFVKESECSKYVRLAAYDLFGKSYSIANAWDRRYKDQIVCIVGNSDLEDLAQRKILLPGMIVRIRNPESPHKKDIDMTGKTALYTHNILYLGVNKNREPLFAEQFFREINVRSERDLRLSLLKPIEVLDAKITEKMESIN